MPTRIKILVKCPLCSMSLMDADHEVDGLPSIRLKCRIGESVGTVFLSQVYGSYEKQLIGVEDTEGVIAQLICPRCQQELPRCKTCKCGAPVVRLDLVIGGSMAICSRNGCSAHSLEFDSVDSGFLLYQSKDVTGLL